MNNSALEVLQYAMQGNVSEKAHGVPDQPAAFIQPLTTSD